MVERMQRTHAAGLSVGLCLMVLALTVPFPAAAQRAAPPAFPTEWQGNDKWCPQSDMATRIIYTRHDHL